MARVVRCPAGEAVMTNDEADVTRPQKRGRPRRLTLDQVIEAALAVGLERLTMAAVADHLGVGKAVLYGYVKGRDELLQLARAQKVRRHSFPADHGQPWAQWVLEYARALFEVLTANGQLLETWLDGGQSSLLEIDAAENWLRTLTRQGFSGEAALQLRRAVSHIVIGAAASAKRDRSLMMDGRQRGASARQAISSRPVDETRMLRQHVDLFAQEVSEDNWEFALYIFLKGVAAAPDTLELNGALSRDLFAEHGLPG